MKKKRSFKSLKAELDRVFSIWIRKRWADPDGYQECVTCGTRRPYKELQAGHWHSRVYLATRWHEKNVHVQCPSCNVLRRGNYPAYAKFMYRTYTQKEIDELDALRHTTVKLTRADLEELIERYSA